MRQNIKNLHSGITRVVASTVVLAFVFVLFPADFERSISAISSLNAAKIIHAGRSPSATRLDVAATGFGIFWMPVFRIFALVGSAKAPEIRKYLVSGETVRAPPAGPIR